MNDACFAALEAEQLTRGGVGVEVRALPFQGPMYELASVAPGSPAEAAGLRSGDALLALNGRALTQASETETQATAAYYNDTILHLARGDKLTYRVRRDGKELNIQVVAGPRSLEAARSNLAGWLLEEHGQKWVDAYRAYVRRHQP
jgi:S1-C subfamily serine protease